jgi:hypothetical protein
MTMFARWQHSHTTWRQVQTSEALGKGQGVPMMSKQELAQSHNFCIRNAASPDDIQEPTTAYISEQSFASIVTPVTLGGKHWNTSARHGGR